MAWLRGWRDVWNYGDIPGYRELPLVQRKAMDLIAVKRALVSRRFGRVLLWMIAAWILTLILSWEFDLTGWQRDVLRALPIVWTLPWIAVARRRNIRALLERRKTVK